MKKFAFFFKNDYNKSVVIFYILYFLIYNNMKKLRNLALAGAGLTTLAVNNVTNAAFQVNTTTWSALSGSDNNLEDSVQIFVQNVLNLLYLIAIIYGLYGGFLILTAAGEDEKVGKGKKVIIHAIIGLVVIFFVGAIINFVMRMLGMVA